LEAVSSPELTHKGPIFPLEQSPTRQFSLNATTKEVESSLNPTSTFQQPQSQSNQTTITTINNNNNSNNSDSSRGKNFFNRFCCHQLNKLTDFWL
jgi:hypothetical protein